MADLERARKTRKQLEAIVHKNMAVCAASHQAWTELLMALDDLKERKLYHPDFKSWQAYVDAEFGVARSTANRWVTQGREIKALGTGEGAKPQVEPSRGAGHFGPETLSDVPSQREAERRAKARRAAQKAAAKPVTVADDAVVIHNHPATPEPSPAPKSFVPSERRPTPGLPPNTNVTFEGIAKSEPVIPSVVALVKFLDNWPDAEISALPLKDRRAVNDRMKRWMSALGMGPTSKTKVETPRAGPRAKGEKCPHPIGRRTKDGHFCYECGSKI